VRHWRLTQHIAHDGIAIADLAALTLACGLVVARTQRRPGRQTGGRCEPPHVVADLDQDQRGADFVDAGDSLQEPPSPRIGLHRLNEIAIQPRDFPFQVVQVVQNGAQHESVPRRQVAILLLVLWTGLIEKSPDANLRMRGSTTDSANCWHRSEAPWGKAFRCFAKIGRTPRQLIARR
jgi:hypothetical protein